VFIDSGERVVIASGSTAVLDVCQRLCRFLKLSYARIDGSTPSFKRTKAAKSFATGTSSPSILLLSARAGGAGLNLQGASVMILCEVQWNPATDEQTMARIWRSGQSRRTRIYRLVAAGTLEETILARQGKKLSLWRAAGVGGDSAPPIDNDSLERSLFVPARTVSAGGFQHYEQGRLPLKRKRTGRAIETGNDWRWMNAPPGTTNQSSTSTSSSSTSSSSTNTNTSTSSISTSSNINAITNRRSINSSTATNSTFFFHADMPTMSMVEDVEVEVVDDSEDFDAFLPFCAHGLVVGSLLRRTKAISGWEERGRVAVATARAAMKPPRKKRKKTPTLDGGSTDNRPMWSRLPWMKKKQKKMTSSSVKELPVHKVFTY